MKVAIFTDTFLPQVNGVTNTLSKLLEYFNDNNIDYLVFSPEYQSKEDDENRINKSFSLKFIFYPECRVALPNIIKIEKALDSFKPDIIHIMTEFNMGLVGLRYGRRKGIPTVSNYTTNFYQYLKYYNFKILEEGTWNYMRWFHNSNNITLCPSNETRRLLNSNGINNVEIFTRGVDLNRFNPSYRSEALREELELKGKIALLYVGRVSIEKNIDKLLKVFSRLKNKYGNRITLTITGDGPELKKYKDNYSDIVNFTGYKKKSELAEIYASHDIFVFPSTTETFGNVVLEAMASGLPVIVANLGGVVDFVYHKENGLIFDGNNIEEDIYKRIEDIINNDILREKIKRQCYETAKGRCWDSIINDLVKIYEKLCYKSLA